MPIFFRCHRYCNIKFTLRSIVCTIHLVYWPPSRDLFPVESDQWIPVINTTLTCWTTNKDKMAKSDSLQCKIFLFCSQKNLVGIYILHKSRDPKISLWSVQQLYNVSIKSALLWSQAMMLWTSLSWDALQPQAGWNAKLQLSIEEWKHLKVEI